MDGLLSSSVAANVRATLRVILLPGSTSLRALSIRADRPNSRWGSEFSKQLSDCVGVLRLGGCSNPSYQSEPTSSSFAYKGLLHVVCTLEDERDVDFGVQSFYSRQIQQFVGDS